MASAALAVASTVAVVGGGASSGGLSGRVPEVASQVSPLAVDVDVLDKTRRPFEGAPAPAGVRTDLWRPVVNPPNLPEVPKDLIQNGMPAVRDVPIEGSGSTAACYPYGHAANPYNDCRNPGMVSPGGPNTTNYTQWLHWGNEPHISPPSGMRYVWVFDSLSTARASEWTQYWVNVMNNYYANVPPGEVVGDRPYYIYYTSEQFNAAPGPCYLGPNTHKQWLEFCETTGGPYANWWWGAETHTIFVSAKINVATTNDPYLGYQVLHEGGHGHGFHHNTDCWSPMTYCGSTVGVHYLWDYTWDDHRAYELLYDSHPAGTKDGVG